MNVSIRFFASLQDITQADKIDLTIESSDLEKLKLELLKKYPALELQINSIRFAVNSEYSSKNIKLNDGDIIALIPPTSGG